MPTTRPRDEKTLRTGHLRDDLVPILRAHIHWLRYLRRTYAREKEWTTLHAVDHLVVDGLWRDLNMRYADEENCAVTFLSPVDESGRIVNDPWLCRLLAALGFRG